MNRERIILILQAVVCVALAVLLALGAVGICFDGLARRAADPLADVYTAEIVSEKLGRIAPLVFLSIGLLIAGIVLGAKDPESGKAAGAFEPAGPRDSPKHTGLIRTVLVAAAVILILLGILNGGALDVLAKAVNICTECIGLG